MKIRSMKGFGLSLLLILAAVDLPAAPGNEKPVRLRKETIYPSAEEHGLGPADAGSFKGLALVQIEGSPKPLWRKRLKDLGVDILHYVPEDAFLVRLNGTPPGKVRQLPFVRWLGRYRSELKLHPSLERRLRRPGMDDVLSISLLVAPGAPEKEKDRIRARMRRPLAESPLREGSILRGAVSSSELVALAESDAVLWIEPQPAMVLYDEVSSEIVGGDGPPGQTLVQSLGYDGSGVTVAVADSGLDSGDIATMHPDIAGRVAALFYYGTAGQLSDASDEHGHGTHCAGIVAGNGTAAETDDDGKRYGLGVASGADLVGQRIFDADGGYAPASSHETMTRDATRAGAEIGSNSWGDDTQGTYDLSAMEFDALVRDADLLTLGDQPYILEFSAGNAGPNSRTIGSPAVAKNVIATGAANSGRDNLPVEGLYTFYDTGPETMADFSSRGPCADGRIKPDIVAPGTWIASLRSVYANDAYAWWPVEGSLFYSYQGGTSQAGPHASGAAAVFVQYYRALHGGATPSPALVKAALINSAADMHDAYGTGPVPNAEEGWGRLDLAALVASARDYMFVDQSVLLTNTEVSEHRVVVGSASAPLKITLAYTDVPGTPYTVLALVNDLDLEVIAPDGAIYRGNLFTNGESEADLEGSDTINNVEGVHLAAPQPGEYFVRIRGTRVVEDARRDSPAVDQDFALVISGSFAASGVGIISLDRPNYMAPDLIRLALVDDDLAGQPTASVQVRSDSEPAGEMVTLQAKGTAGVFTGEVATAMGSVQPDGLLQISHEDLIEAVYADQSPASNRVFTATADMLAPIISNVIATIRFGDIFVSWDTDEPAGGEVYYGTTDLAQGVTNRAFTTSHELRLIGVVPYEAYTFMVVSADPAGNRTTNDNSGAYFTFTLIPPPDVLLVDSYTDYDGLIASSPLSGYTNALNETGVGYDVFDALTGAEPTLAQLQAYRCVIWRMDEVVAPSVSLAHSISNYVGGGGSLLIASMEAPTRLTEAGLAGFNTGLLQLQSYTEDQPVNAVVGAPGDPVGAGLNTVLDYTPYADLLNFLEFVGVSDPSDWIVPNTNASVVIQSGSVTVGIRSPKTGVDLPGKVVYLSFPLDAVPMGSGLDNNRSGLLKNILDFLSPPAGSSIFTLDSDVYSVPARALVEIEDPDRSGQGQVAVDFFSPMQTNGVTLTLYETARPGLFRGDVNLVPSISGTPGTLAVQPGDTLQGEYVKTPGAFTNVVTATIETTPPVISSLQHDEGYLEALVTWDTSENADALVQYSESPNNLPINYTEYDPQFRTSHALYLSQLKADQTYYYRVISRDRAGNTAIDDNSGQLYTFTTLQPLAPPWQDDMETNSLAWTTYTTDPGFQGWTRGAPGGGESARSPTNCWGSNLGGGPLDADESYLISPGIHLEGGNHATLRFWHNYDFIAKSELDIIEIGAVEIITNAFTQPVLLTQFDTDASFGWEEVEIDLTPYVGQVVYLVWYYVQLSTDAPPRLGWLVDDVSVMVDTVVPGTLQVTNNLWQAIYAVSGPSGFVGNGRWSEITNAVPGEYIVEFGDVAYYQTPPPQTNTLGEGETVTFTGHYTFPDTNTNGIPDGWELARFGVVDPLHEWVTDTDGDGVSDGDESVALTDPNHPPPAFALGAVYSNNTWLLEWSTVPGTSYRVLNSTDLSLWNTLTDWIVAVGPLTNHLVIITGSEQIDFFSVEAGPSTTGLAAYLQLALSHQPGDILRIQWPSTAGLGYRLWESDNGFTWGPLTDWFRATGPTSSYIYAPSTHGTLRWFRLEVAP